MKHFGLYLWENKKLLKGSVWGGGVIYLGLHFEKVVLVPCGEGLERGKGRYEKLVRRMLQ